MQKQFWFERRMLGDRSFFHAAADETTSLCKKSMGDVQWRRVFLPSAPSRLYLCSRCAKAGGLIKPDYTMPTPDPDPRFTTYIYIIRDGEYCKIGIANDVAARFRDLQCANPKQLAVVYCSLPLARKDAREVELAVQRHFDAYRSDASHQREWFKLGESTMSVAREIEERVSKRRGAV